MASDVRRIPRTTTRVTSALGRGPYSYGNAEVRGSGELCSSRFATGAGRRATADDNTRRFDAAKLRARFLKSVRFCERALELRGFTLD